MEKQKEIVLDFSCWLIWHWVFYINIYHCVLCSHKHHSPHTMHYFIDHRISQIAVRFQFFSPNLNPSREKMLPKLFIILLFSIIVNVLNWRFLEGGCITWLLLHRFIATKKESNNWRWYLRIKIDESFFVRAKIIRNICATTALAVSISNDGDFWW